eukprot:gnl/MRDRNA2_/MRDRNA2_88429_c0_seq1.p1 gnl/MRDRNA2_/MRDRNA2_88429_c0~~gnl/MRDRNA2_/MRDRNA2_88429_c0_seq1.p1  ORF type:complete len:141 (+),score=30.74 gnl/MRDRNA2_/MRDRNA2_88429_c0_seq1:106-528(+)
MFRVFLCCSDRDKEVKPKDAPQLRSLPSGWEKVTSRASGETYYFNPASGVSQWEYPNVATMDKTTAAANEKTKEKEEAKEAVESLQQLPTLLQANAKAKQAGEEAKQRAKEAGEEAKHRAKEAAKDQVKKQLRKKVCSCL